MDPINIIITSVLVYLHGSIYSHGIDKNETFKCNLDLKTNHKMTRRESIKWVTNKCNHDEELNIQNQTENVNASDKPFLEQGHFERE